MAGGYEARKLPSGEWGLKALFGGWAVDDDGNPQTFPTRKDADKARRERERRMTGLNREPKDFMRTRLR